MTRFARALLSTAIVFVALVAPPSVAAVPLIPTTTSVTVSPAVADAGNHGTSLTWLINVIPQSGGPATGTGTYTLSGPGGPIATNAFNASQADVQITASDLGAGTYTMSATYPGDGAFGPSSGSAAGDFAMVATTTTVTVNPSTAHTGSSGESITWTIKVTRNTGSGSVVGTGTYTLTGPSGPIATNTFDAAQSSNVITATGLSAGKYTLSAIYAGDGSTFLSSSGSADGTFLKVATTTTVTVNPTTTPAGSGGGSMTWVINVTPDTGTGPVAGTGTYTLSGPNGPLATNTFNAATPNVAVTASGFSPGTYTLSATYPGNLTFDPSSGSAAGQFVAANAAVALTSSLNPSIAGQSVKFTAAVTGSGGTPTGTVTFKDGSATLGSASLDFDRNRDVDDVHALGRKPRHHRVLLG